MKYRLVEKTESLSFAATDYSEWVDIGGEGGDSISCTAVIDVDTPAAKTFDSGVASSLEVQDLTYTAVVRGEAGDEITIEYIADGTAGAETVDVTGTNIVVHMDDTAVIGSTADDILAAIEASAEADALVSVAVTGTGSNVQAAAAETPLAGGADSEVNIDDDEVTVPGHGYNVGLKVRLTTTGTLPTGVTTGVDYFIIVIDDDTIQFAASLVDAQAGDAIDLTSQGTSGAVNTITATAIAGGSIVFQQANNKDYPVDIGSPTAITVDASVQVSADRPTYRYVRAKIALTAGNISADLYWLVKGDKDV